MAVQALALLTLFAAQGVVLSEIRADRRADLRADSGFGTTLPLGVVASEASPPVALTIPTLKIDTRLSGLRKDLDGALQVPADPLRAGWYSQGPAPGDDGPAVIVGHVDSRRGPGIFAQLDTLTAGDQLDVRRADGSVVTFLVQSVKTYAKRDFPTQAVYLGDGTTSLRLITCGGDFDPNARSYLSNVIVFAVPA